MLLCVLVSLKLRPETLVTAVGRYAPVQTSVFVPVGCQMRGGGSAGHGWDFQRGGLPKALRGGGSSGCVLAFHLRVFWKVLGAAAAAGVGPLVPEAQLSHASLNRKGKGSEHCDRGQPCQPWAFLA